MSFKSTSRNISIQKFKNILSAKTIESNHLYAYKQKIIGNEPRTKTLDQKLLKKNNFLKNLTSWSTSGQQQSRGRGGCQQNKST